MVRAFGRVGRAGQMGRMGLMGRVSRSMLHILIVAIAGGSTPVYAQAPTLPASAAVAAAADADTSAVRLFVGRSTILDVGSPIARVSLTSADVADAMVTQPSQLLINGKAPGTISMFVWDRGGAVRRYEIAVQRDLARLSEQMKQLFPGERIEVQSNGKNVVLSGSVSNKEVMEKAVNVAAGYTNSKEEVVTLLQLQAGAPSNQVLLRVRFAEVSRSALTELGASFFTSPLGVENTLGRVTTQQFNAPGFDKIEYTKEGLNFGDPVTSAKGEFNFGDFLNLFFFNQQYDLGMMIKALSTRGMFQSLAEPNLVAESGKEASFLAGGEFPIPVAQGSGANIGVSVVFKEFGVRLNFTPTVEGNRVHLKVRPEVSSLDFNNAVVLNGFRIPALSTRRTETELELQNGQTFAIAGLLNNTVRSSLSKIPGIGDIPILGLLFKSKAAQKDQTELVVMITPHILPNNSSGVTPNLPRTPEPYLAPLPNNQTHPQPPDAFSPDRSSSARPTGPASALGTSPAPSRADVVPAYGATAQAPAASRTAAPPAPAASNPAAAAAAVSALTPTAPRVVTPAADAAPVAGSPGTAATAATPAAPALDATPGASNATTRPLTTDEKKAIERARREEDERARREAQAYARQKAIEGRRLADQQAVDNKKAEEQRKRDEKAAKEQAKRDAEAAKRQAELDREQQKAIEAAAAQLKAAEARYNAELAKKEQK